MNEIIELLKKCPIHHSKDNNDDIMYCDLEYRVICYSTGRRRLFEIKTVFYPVIHHNGKTRESFNRTIQEKEYDGVLEEIKEYVLKHIEV